jgi:hypothetical protein
VKGVRNGEKGREREEGKERKKRGERERRKAIMSNYSDKRAEHSIPQCNIA